MHHEYSINKVLKCFKATAKDEDNTIEEIKYIDNTHFLVGVQFHLEDLEKT